MANVLVVAMLAPVFGHLGVGAAFAQAARLTRQIRVIVLDVQDVSGEQVADNLGSLTRDAVWAEMHLNRWFLPTPQREVQAALERGETRGELTLPLDKLEQQRLATNENVEGVVTGQVRVVSVSGDPRVATVELQLMLLDQLSGYYINGARVVASSDPRPGYEGADAALIQEAVNKASAEAVSLMGRYEVPEGYVLAGEGSDIIRISVGEREGIREGDRFIVIGRAADRDRVDGGAYPEIRGCIQVGDPRANYSICHRVEVGRAYQVNTGDFVRMLYPEDWMTEDPSGSTEKESGGTEGSKTRKNLPKILAIVALLVIFGVLLDQNGSHTTASVGVRASGVNIPGLPDAMVRVRWNPGGAIPPDPQQRAGYIIGYEIHRGTTPEFPVTPNSMIEFLEGGRNTRFDDTASSVAYWVTATVTPTSDEIGLYYVERATETEGAATWTLSEQDATYTFQYTPPVPGQLYYYAIRVLSKRLGAQPFPTTDGGDVEDEQLLGQLFVSTSSRCGPATPVQPPVLQSPPDYPDPGSLDVDLNTALFEWTAAAGADTYVIEMSTDRTFPTAQTIRSQEILARVGAGQTIARLFEGTGGQTPSTVFANWDGPIYWRVGARSSLDQYSPINADGTETRFVFGLERSFQTLDSPPPSP